MKKKLCLLLCLVLCLSFLSACGFRQTDKAATAAHAAAEPRNSLKPLAAQVSMQYGLPRVTKDPTDEWVSVGGRCQFVSRYENAILAEWHFISPDGRRDITYIQVQKEFPSLKIIMGNTKDMTLDNIPQSLSGWRVYCRFSNNVGAVNTGSALITVLPGPSSYGLPWPTGNGMIVFYIDGTTERVSEYSDSTWKTSGGTVYYLGTDGILRSGGAPDLYTWNPRNSYNPSGSSLPTGNSMIAYYSSGTAEYLTAYSDGTWRTASGISYSMGTDGVLRARNAPDLYTWNPYHPASGAYPTGRNMIGYYANGAGEYLTEYSDGTWRTPGGVFYYLGADNVLRANGAEDLYPK